MSDMLTIEYAEVVVVVIATEKLPLTWHAECHGFWVCNWLKSVQSEP
jgi:hypothetical protein